MDTDKILNIALIGAVAVGGIYVLKQLTGANLAKEAGTATGEAVGGAAGGFVGGVTTGAIDAGKDLGKSLGFYDGWFYDLVQKTGLTEQQLLGTKGTFPNGDVFYTKNGVQTPTDEQWLQQHPEYRRETSTSSKVSNELPNNSALVFNQVPSPFAPTATGAAAAAKYYNTTPSNIMDGSFKINSTPAVTPAPLPVGFGAKVVSVDSKGLRTIDLGSQKTNAFTYISGKGWGYW
jgi:hypothetical protein